MRKNGTRWFLLLAIVVGVLYGLSFQHVFDAFLMKWLSIPWYPTTLGIALLFLKTFLSKLFLVNYFFLNAAILLVIYNFLVLGSESRSHDRNFLLVLIKWLLPILILVGLLVEVPVSRISSRTGLNVIYFLFLIPFFVGYALVVLALVYTLSINIRSATHVKDGVGSALLSATGRNVSLLIGMFVSIFTSVFFLGLSGEENLGGLLIIALDVAVFVGLFALHLIVRAIFYVASRMGANQTAADRASLAP
ncbi:MAG: hypothetical protein AB1664_22825 [Thermodesulfobacteriota bacterium]